MAAQQEVVDKKKVSAAIVESVAHYAEAKTGTDQFLPTAKTTISDLEYQCIEQKEAVDIALSSLKTKAPVIRLPLNNETIGRRSFGF